MPDHHILRPHSYNWLNHETALHKLWCVWLQYAPNPSQLLNNIVFICSYMHVVDAHPQQTPDASSLQSA